MLIFINKQIDMSELLFKVPQLEFKRKNRFLVKYPSVFEFEDNYCVTHNASRPSYNAIKGKWADIEFELHDPIAPSTSQIIMDGIRELEHIKLLQGKKKDGKPSEMVIELEMLDPTGIVIEKWAISGVIKNIDFCALDFKDDSLASVKITFKVKSAILSF